MLYMTLKEGAEYLRISERHLKELLIQKQIPAGKIGNTWRVAREDIDTFVRNGGQKPCAVQTPLVKRKVGRPRKTESEGVVI